MLEEASPSHAFALERSFAGVLGMFATLDEVFVMTRNESCVLATVAGPLRYAAAGRRAIAWSEELTMKLSTRKAPEVVAYHEEGGEAEFFDDRSRGFLKVFPTNGISATSWNESVSRVATGFYPVEALPFLRKTNHLSEPGAERVATLSSLPPVALRESLNAFFARATELDLSVQVKVPCGMLSADMVFKPREFTWMGPWLFANSSLSGVHLRVEQGFSITESEKAAGSRTLDVFDAGGGFVARLTSRPIHNKRP